MKGQERIDEVFVFVCVDADGTEGVPGITGPDGVVWPMFAADRARVDSLRLLARQIARGGRKVTLCRFSKREELEEFKP